MMSICWIQPATHVVAHTTLYSNLRDVNNANTSHDIESAHDLALRMISSGLVQHEQVSQLTRGGFEVLARYKQDACLQSKTSLAAVLQHRPMHRDIDIQKQAPEVPTARHASVVELLLEKLATQPESTDSCTNTQAVTVSHLKLLQRHRVQAKRLQLLMDFQSALQLPEHLLAILYAHARVHHGWHGRPDGCNELCLPLHIPAQSAEAAWITEGAMMEFTAAGWVALRDFVSLAGCFQPQLSRPLCLETGLFPSKARLTSNHATQREPAHAKHSDTNHTGCLDLHTPT